MATLNVGVGQQYTTIASAIAASKDGDVIAVQAGTYVNDFATITTKISIVGVGGFVKMVATQPIPNDKGILVATKDLSVENIEFVGASVYDQNGAGIRLEPGANLNVNNCYFHDCENGILTSNSGTGKVVIRNSEFADNGAGDGQSHGIYIGKIESLEVYDSYFHGTDTGHHIKSRAAVNVIEGNRIVDGEGGTASYNIDLPNGGVAVIRDNIIEQSPQSDNWAMIHYGGEHWGSPHPNSSLVIENNIFQNFRNPGTAIDNATSVVAQVTNNEFYNLSNIGYGPMTQSGNTKLTTPVTVDESHPWTGADPHNTAPDANSDSAATSVGQSVKINVLKNDTDLDSNPLNVTGVTQAANGTVTINPDKTVTYTPKAGFTGTDTFTYTITDGKATDTAQVAINVTPAGASVMDKLEIAPEDSWVQLNTNLFKDVWVPTALQTPGGSTNPSAVIYAWSGMAWDSNRNDLIFWGGGHSDYAGNEVYRWDSDTGKWERGSLPSAIKQVGTNKAMYETVDGPDNAPIASHAYDNSEFMPIVDRFVTFGGAAFDTGGAFYSYEDKRLTGPYFWDPAKADANKVGGLDGSGVNPNTPGGQMWENRDNLDLDGDKRYPGDTAYGMINSTTDYATENGKDVIYIGDLHLWKYTVNDVNDPTKDTYEKVGTYNWDFAGQGVGSVDMTHKIYVRTAEEKLVFWDLTKPGSSAQTFVPVDPSGQFDFGKLRNYGMDFDSRRGQFVLWDGGVDVWILKPPATTGTNGWTLARDPVEGLPGGPVHSGYFNGVIGKWKYVEELDVFMGVTDSVNGTVWAYKPKDWAPNDGGSVPPPPVPPTDPIPPASIVGTNGADVLVGAAVNQTITGGKGDDRMTGGGAHDTFVINAGDGNDTIVDFAGPKAANAAAEADLIKFVGTGMTAENMRLEQVGSDVVVTFDGVGGTKLTLKNTTVAALDNQQNSAYGFLFNGQTAPTDSFDVVTGAQVARANAVTFLGDAANTTSGLDGSKDVINGMGGNDTIVGKSGDDVLRGDAGNDTLDGGLGNDRLEGGIGDDKLIGGAGNDMLFGGGGNDFALFSGLSTDYAFTMGSTVTIRDLKPTVGGDDGTDTLVGVSRAQFADRVVFLDGTNNAPVAFDDSGTTKADTAFKGNVLTNDVDFDLNVLKLAGATLTTAHGASVSLAADGSFTYDPRGSSELKTLLAGNALLDSFTYKVDDGRGGVATGTVKITVNGVAVPQPQPEPEPEPAPGATKGTANADRLFGGNGDDTILGLGGDDRIGGLAGNDWLDGGLGHDHLEGGLGNDRLFGSDGNDRLVGDAGNDVLKGGAGIDNLSGGAGNDVLDGGAGIDILHGGAGNDIFVYARGYESDSVMDFRAGDKIDLSAFGLDNMAQLSQAAEISNRGFAVTLDFGGGDRLTVMGLAKLTADQVIF